ncbi:hypothetical protein [Dokdonella sp.]|uniref:hypothetical protein n=1 Tax=Dokdonella sp. TaxID=2291710 RepID=UPI002F42EBC4
MTTTRALGLTVIGAAIYIVATGVALPDPVASHFGAGGRADGAMTRNAYLALMIGVCCVLPLALALPMRLVVRLPAAFLSLPDKAYWLAPERAAATRAWLADQGAAFGILLCLFLCYTHTLVVRAHATSPPHLDERLMLGGLAAFGACIAGWLARFVLHFRVRR